jgi:hypothetical protein
MLRRLLVCLSLGALLGNQFILSSPTVASAKAFSGATYNACMKKKMTPITTSKGNKEIRAQLNKLFQQGLCWNEEVKIAFATTTRRINDTQRKYTEAQAAVTACIRKTGLTEAQWTKRYSSSNSGPCVAEVNASLSAFARNDEARSSKPWQEHNTWLAAMASIGRLAKLYPDSVQPKFLTFVLDWADAAKSCLSSKRWCYTGAAG